MKKKNKFPIICTCNSIKNKKIKLLTKNALTLRIAKPSSTELKQLGEHIISNGGNISNTVSKKIYALIVGSDPGSKLEKADKLGVKVIEAEDFFKILKL